MGRTTRKQTQVNEVALSRLYFEAAWTYKFVSE